MRRFVPGPSGRKRYNVLAALNAVTHEVIRVANHSYINAESVCDLLREIAAAGLPRPDHRGAGQCPLSALCGWSKPWHGRLKIELLFLPTYSPEPQPDRAVVEVREERVLGQPAQCHL